MRIKPGINLQSLGGCPRRMLAVLDEDEELPLQPTLQHEDRDPVDYGSDPLDLLIQAEEEREREQAEERVFPDRYVEMAYLAGVPDDFDEDAELWNQEVRRRVDNYLKASRAFEYAKRRKKATHRAMRKALQHRERQTVNAALRAIA